MSDKLAQRGEQLPDIELRTTQASVELRSGANGRMRVGGYAAKFNSRSEPLGSFREIVSPGFFNKSKGDGWSGVCCRRNHKDEYLLGTTASGSLRLAVDGVGLDCEVDLLESRSDLFQLIQRGDVASSSFAFLCFDDTFEYSDGLALRTLLSGRLIDVAPVTTGLAAYSNTSVSLRSLARHMDAPLEDVERYAQTGELRQFFCRGDSQLGDRHVTGPWFPATAHRGGLSSKQKLLQTMAVRDSPEHVKPLTAKQQVVQTLAARWPSDAHTKSTHQKMLETMGMWPQ